MPRQVHGVCYGQARAARAGPLIMTPTEMVKMVVGQGFLLHKDLTGPTATLSSRLSTLVASTFITPAPHGDVSYITPTVQGFQSQVASNFIDPPRATWRRLLHRSNGPMGFKPQVTLLVA